MGVLVGEGRMVGGREGNRGGSWVVKVEGRNWKIYAVFQVSKNIKIKQATKQTCYQMAINPHS